MDLLEHRHHGLTSLPRDRRAIAHKLEASWALLDDPEAGPSEDKILLVLEEGSTGTIVGVSGIAGRLGADHPVRHWAVDHDRLIGSTACTGCGEIGSLFLHPRYRGNGNGSLLSRGRFLFIAAHRRRVADRIVARMRGISDDHGDSPFYDAIGRARLGLSFTEADRLCGLGDDHLLDRMPWREALDLSQLDLAARHAIGRVHPLTEPALHLLRKEGFRDSGWVDSLDGGPIISCATDRIETIRRIHQRPLRIGNVTEIISARLLVATGQDHHWRCTAVTTSAPPTLDAPLHIGRMTSLLLEAHDGALALCAPMRLPAKLDAPTSVAERG